ncbi:class I SAM-dependent methyltransferase [Xanthomonas theicola]|uniref:class I SAM-dependent methyltransferase n=1 Tax=Xanthomonas theicola TaxID=56464 RepID=UPI001FE24E90|nr:class I SAM-dependent methyltransferase [Xanthomonas theicola]
MPPAGAHRSAFAGDRRHDPYAPPLYFFRPPQSIDPLPAQARTQRAVAVGDPMLTIQALNNFISGQAANGSVSRIWHLIGEHFEQAQATLPTEHAMQRRELSFHDHVRLLGYLCLLLEGVPGDLVEIGVWKGKSLALMNEVSNRERRVIGLDPFALPNQFEEFDHYRQLLLPNALFIRGFSEFCAQHFYNMKPQVALLHIDGGHTGRNVLLDFLLHSPSVVPGGFVVFDDYGDHEHSPEVGPAVNLLRATGCFNGFHSPGLRAWVREQLHAAAAVSHRPAPWARWPWNNHRHRQARRRDQRRCSASALHGVSAAIASARKSSTKPR